MKVNNDNFDSLDGWREDVGIKTDGNGNRIFYGRCEEEDTMVTAIKEYEKEQAEKLKKENEIEEENTL